jgi:hypothetical protein
MDKQQQQLTLTTAEQGIINRSDTCNSRQIRNITYKQQLLYANNNRGVATAGVSATEVTQATAEILGTLRTSNSCR